MSQIITHDSPEPEKLNWELEFENYVPDLNKLGEDADQIINLIEQPEYALDDLEDARMNIDELYNSTPMTIDNVEDKMAQINAQLLLSSLEDSSIDSKLNDRINILDNLPVLNPYSDKHFVIKGTDANGNSIYRSITKNNIDIFAGITFENDDIKGGSDGFNEIMDFNSYDLQIELQDNSKNRRGAEGFNFTTEKNGLERYQIFTEEQLYDNQPFKLHGKSHIAKEVTAKYNCLLYSLYVLGEDISEIQTWLHGIHIKMSSFRKVAEILNVKITLTKLEKGVTRYSYYNPNAEREINLAILDGHYFVNESIPKEEVFRLCGINRKMKSFHVIKAMEFTPIIGNNIFCDREPLRPSDKNFLIETKPVIHKPRSLFNKKGKPKYEYLLFADIESYTCTDIHTPYLISWTTALSLQEPLGQWGVRHSYNKACIDIFLTSIPPNSLIIFHNMQYDMSMITNYLYNPNVTVKDNTTYAVEGFYKRKKLTFHDSYKIIPSKLSDFPAMFSLECEKEIYPYEFYNTLSTSGSREGTGNIDDVLQYLKPEDHDGFKANCKKLGMRNKFNYRKYAEFYCDMDVKVLAQGYLKFRSFLMEEHDMDALNYLTISSYADEYFKGKSCYEGVYEIGGDLREFMQEDVVGGRVMMNSNKKYNVKFKKGKGGYVDFICDFDAVSLYPSAMKRIPGFPIGEPINLPKLNSYEELIDLVKDNYYTVRIKINHIGIKRDFPLISVKTEGRDFINENVEMVVNKISLEDLIEFQKIEFEIIEGIWFPDGYNDKIKKEIENIFDIRLKMKKLKNPLQAVIKNLMNSSYGKTILKPSPLGYKMFSNKEKFDKYYNDNGALIETFYKYTHPCEYMDGTNELKTLYACDVNNDMYKHFNRPQCGSLILAMSKRIMNETMCLAEDNGIKVYLQDTDSIHSSYRDVLTLAKLFKDKYNRDLVGGGMGQFHTDFDPIDYGSETGSVHLFALQKKIYCDELRPFKVIGYNDYNLPMVEEKNGIFQLSSDEVKYHIRMKGVSHSSIHDLCERKNMSIMDLYEGLFIGKKFRFNLIAGSVKFKYNHKFQQISSRHKFERLISTIKYDRALSLSPSGTFSPSGSH